MEKIQIFFYQMESRNIFEETEEIPEDILGDVMCSATKGRFWAAVGEGRTPHRDGPPPYLENEEEKLFIQKIQMEIIKGNNPTVLETCYIVFLYTYIFCLF
jgi:hypothetical protein